MTRSIVSEKPVASVNFNLWISSTFTISQNNKRIAYIAKGKNKLFAVIDGVEGKRYEYIAS